MFMIKLICFVLNKIYLNTFGNFDIVQKFHFMKMNMYVFNTYSKMPSEIKGLSIYESIHLKLNQHVDELEHISEINRKLLMHYISNEIRVHYLITAKDFQLHFKFKYYKIRTNLFGTSAFIPYSSFLFLLGIHEYVDEAKLHD